MRPFANLLDHPRDFIFLKDHRRELSFGDFLRKAEQTASRLRSLGVKKSDFVTFVPQNSVESVVFIFGVLFAEATPVLWPRRRPLDPSLALSFSNEQIFEIVHGDDSGLIHAGLSPGQRVVFFTSGTSSEPKRAVLTLSNFYFNAAGSFVNIPFYSGDTWFLNLPLEHVGGFAILWRALFGGGSVYLDDPQSLPLQHEITHSSLVMTQLFRLLHGEVSASSSYKAILLGGSAFPKALIDDAVKRGLPIYKSYGMTEMASQIATTTTTAEISSSGRLLPHRELKIEAGQILVRGACLFEGYQDGDVVTRPEKQGWFETRDRGEWNADGTLRVTGRTDRMFISAGENIQPEAIERVLLEYPGVTSAKVCPEPDPEYGARPVAYVKTTKELKNDALKAFVKDHLTGLYVPQKILPWEQIPTLLRSAKDL